MLAIFGLWVLLLGLQKPVFLLLYTGGVAQALPVMWHGLPLDLSMAGYLSAIPGLLLLVSSVPLRVLHTERGERMVRKLLHWWFVIAAIVVALAFVTNCALYDYWRFPLDSTPIFFITSSPKDALASVSWLQGLGGVAAVVVIAFVIQWLFKRLVSHFDRSAYKMMSPWRALVMLLAVALLFLPIRGGVTVSSMNIGKVYFSDNQLLNHAAVNPLFSFMESMMHQKDFADQYRFMDDVQANQLTAKMLQYPGVSNDSTHISILSNQHPDIYLIILESFSDTLTKVNGVTPCLNRLSR